MSKRSRVEFSTRSNTADRLPPGPQSVEELYDWPLNNARILAENSDAIARLHSLLVGKITVYGDYSGYMSEKEALTLGFEGLRVVCDWKTLVTSSLVFARACDVLPLQLNTLCEISRLGTGSTMCVFDDVVRHVIPEAAALISAMVPLSCGLKTVRNYANQLTWLLENRAWVFPKEGKRQCIVHDCMCFTHPLGGFDRSRHESSAASSSHVVEELGEVDETERRPLCIHFAGVTCNPWSQFGAAKRFEHESEFPHNVYVLERIVRAEQDLDDINFLECTPQYPFEEKVAQPLRKTHKSLDIKDDPHLHGHPVARHRMFAVSMSLATIVWVGPDDYEADFKAKFHQMSMLHGSDLMVAPEDERLEYYSRLAQVQGNYVAKETIAGLDDQQLLQTILSPGQVRRAREYVDVRASKQSLDGRFLADLEHNNTARPRCGTVWPTQVSHGCIVSLPVDGKPCVATPLEYLGAQGVHLFPRTSKTFGPSVLRQVFSGLGDRQSIELSGRGVHIDVLSAWMLYVLSNIVRVDRRHRLGRELSACMSEEGGDGDALEINEKQA
jgi:hypothetical protein